ncbi:hypothetical protein DEO72_LG4g316 [Vigna unguiculata]|uniref:Uncharacterized protein n=1 Tax=Vigna unguiculata TaxID=3917 RepID=A0A4D6LKU6_VIGUN|nr:hypothetical protein DEO72_LG4g316 [Vigna unguiculata]
MSHLEMKGAVSALSFISKAQPQEQKHNNPNSQNQNSEEGKITDGGATIRLGGVASKLSVAHARRGSRILEHRGSWRHFWWGLVSSPTALTNREAGVIVTLGL